MPATLDPETTRCRIELLAGTTSPANPTIDDFWREVCGEVASLDDLTWESLNKLLVTAGFNRVSNGFFAFFKGLAGNFDDRLTAWRTLAMLHFGNFRWPFRQRSRRTLEELQAEFIPERPDYGSRERVRAGLRPIERRDLPMLGTIAGKPARLIEAKIDAGSTPTEAESGYLSRLASAKSNGLHNIYEYCAMEHMDVYVATSMRQAEEFYAVNRFVTDLMAVDHDPLDLSKVSYFDPTQKYHPDRIVTGLVEAMMLKRARCTVYLAQERDTLGKDSELASTLAQGKPVIAYIPKIEDNDAFAAQVEEDLTMAVADPLVAQTRVDPGIEPRFARLADRYQSVLPEGWLDAPYRDGITDAATYEQALGDFVTGLASMYEERASNLHQKHPLGIQVSIGTGVPNGVLVTRTVSDCREVLVDVLTHNLGFAIEARDPTGATTEPDLTADMAWDRLLRERGTGSIYRVVIGDVLVSNAYWNWYAVEEAST